MEDFKTYFTALRDELKQYVDARLELLQLSIYEKAAKVAAELASVVVIAFCSFFLLLFVFIALAIWFGKILDNYSLGFGLIAFFYFAMLLLFFMIRKKHFVEPIMNKIIGLLKEEEDEEEANQ